MSRSAGSQSKSFSRHSFLFFLTVHCLFIITLNLPYFCPPRLVSFICMKKSCSLTSISAWILGLLCNYNQLKTAHVWTVWVCVLFPQNSRDIVECNHFPKVRNRHDLGLLNTYDYCAWEELQDPICWSCKDFISCKIKHRMHNPQ